MGRLQIIDTLQYTKTEQALIWHLRGNHYPPISLDFLKTAKRAIKEAKKENWDLKIKMPNGIIKSVSDIIEGLHLESFLI